MLVHSLSIPRSGHHFLVSMLASHLGEGFAHRSRGKDDSPWPDRAAIRLVKSHDPRLTGPRHEARDALIVQTREPGTQIQSEAQRQRERRGEKFRIDDPQFVELWLARSAIYHRAFLKKWASGRQAGRVVVAYEDLRADPAVPLAAVLQLAGVEPDAGRVVEVVAANQELQPFTPAEPSQPRRPFVARGGVVDGPLDVELVLDYVNACRRRPRQGGITRAMRLLEGMQDPQVDADKLLAEADALGNIRLRRQVEAAQARAA